MPGVRPEAGGGHPDLRAWAVSRSDPSAARTVGLEPGRLPGTAVVPFPKVEHEEYRKMIRGAGIPKRVETAPVEDVPLASLTSAQRTVNLERLEQHLEDPRLARRGSRAPSTGMLRDKPVVVRIGGRSYIHDGNHRSTAALLRGERTIRARVVDLDEGSDR